MNQARHNFGAMSTTSTTFLSAQRIHTQPNQDEVQPTRLAGRFNTVVHATLITTTLNLTTKMTSTMHTTPFHTTLPSLPSLPPKPRVANSPYPVARKSTSPVTPARKAYRQLKSMLSNLKLTKTSQVTTALGHNTQSQCHEIPAPTDVTGGQLAPGHPITPVQPHETAVRMDEFYGWAQVAKTSARFVSTLLDCPEILPSTDLTEVNPDLAHFIAFALSRSRMPLCVHQYALHLIWRVKSLNPEFKPKHAHGTYLTALMLAAKHSHDGVYSLNDWASIGQDIFEPSQLRENEWRMCERLEWRFLVHPMDLVKLAWTIEVEYAPHRSSSPRDAILLKTSYKSPTAAHVFSFSTSDTNLFPLIPSAELPTTRTHVDLHGFAIEALSPTTTLLTLLEQSSPSNSAPWTGRGSGGVPASMVAALAGIGETVIRGGGAPPVVKLSTREAKGEPSPLPLSNPTEKGEGNGQSPCQVWVPALVPFPALKPDGERRRKWTKSLSGLGSRSSSLSRQTGGSDEDGEGMAASAATIIPANSANKGAPSLSSSPESVSRSLTPSSTSISSNKGIVFPTSEPTNDSSSTINGASETPNSTTPQAAVPPIELELRVDPDSWSPLEIVVDPPPSAVRALRRHRLARGGGGLWITIEHTIDQFSSAYGGGINGVNHAGAGGGGWDDRINVTVRKALPPSPNDGNNSPISARDKDKDPLSEWEDQSSGGEGIKTPARTAREELLRFHGERARADSTSRTLDMKGPKADNLGHQRSNSLITAPRQSTGRPALIVNGARVKVDVEELPEAEVKALAKAKRVKPMRIPLDEPPVLRTKREKPGGDVSDIAGAIEEAEADTDTEDTGNGTGVVKTVMNWGIGMGSLGLGMGGLGKRWAPAGVNMGVGNPSSGDDSQSVLGITAPDVQSGVETAITSVAQPSSLLRLVTNTSAPQSSASSAAPVGERPPIATALDAVAFLTRQHSNNPTPDSIPTAGGWTPVPATYNAMVNSTLPRASITAIESFLGAGSRAPTPTVRYPSSVLAMRGVTEEEAHESKDPHGLIWTLDHEDTRRTYIGSSYHQTTNVFETSVKLSPYAMPPPSSPMQPPASAIEPTSTSSFLPVTGGSRKSPSNGGGSSGGTAGNSTSTSWGRAAGSRFRSRARTLSSNAKPPDMNSQGLIVAEFIIDSRLFPGGYDITTTSMFLPEGSTQPIPLIMPDNASTTTTRIIPLRTQVFTLPLSPLRASAVTTTPPSRQLIRISLVSTPHTIPDVLDPLTGETRRGPEQPEWKQRLANEHAIVRVSIGPGTIKDKIRADGILVDVLSEKKSIVALGRAALEDDHVGYPLLSRSRVGDGPKIPSSLSWPVVAATHLYSDESPIKAPPSEPAEQIVEESAPFSLVVLTCNLCTVIHPLYSSFIAGPGLPVDILQRCLR
ncbi:hypothetical protein RSAG8_03199, partial [Rhizoctonia solani AG-8 WAC10335]